jgi:hypothetical protein
MCKSQAVYHFFVGHTVISVSLRYSRSSAVNILVTFQDEAPTCQPRSCIKHRKHINHLKNSVFWDVTPCGFVRDDVSEERVVSIIRVRRISKLGTTLALTSNYDCLHCSYLDDSFDPDDGGDMFLRNVGSY